jgi:hypothetical protein
MLVALLLLLACKNGDCEFGPVDEYKRCAEACAPHAMKSFTPGNGCQTARCECVDGAVDAGH